MDLNDIKEKYPNLKKYLRFLSPDNILQRTFAIEKTGNEEILDEWIEYWSEINRINATKIIVNLKSISEEKRNNYKEMLIKKITTSYSNNSNYKKLYYLIMVNLYFNDEKEIENILKYLRWVIGIESEDTDEAEKISPIETVEYILRKRDIRKVKSKEKLIKLLGIIIHKFKSNIKYVEFFNSENLLVINELEDILTNLKETKKPYKLYIEKIVKKIVSLRTIKGVENEFAIASINKDIFNVLLKESNYKTIFRYIYLLDSCNLFYLIKLDDLSRLDKAPIVIVDNIIRQIVNSMIKKDRYDYAFLFLRRIRVKDYFKYIPYDRLLTDYFDLFDKYKNNSRRIRFNFDIINVKKELLFKIKYTGNNYIECLKLWIDFLEKDGKNNSLIRRSKLQTLYEMINYDIELLDKDNYVKDKFYELSKYVSKQEINNNSNSCLKAIDKILSCNDNLKNIVDKIKIFKNTNFFLAKDFYEIPDAKELDYINTNNSIRVHIKNLFLNLLLNIEEEDLEDIIYLYMNTSVKYDISIEYLILELCNKNFNNILSYINEYSFFATLSKKSNSKIYDEFKIRNVKSDNFARCLKDNKNNLGRLNASLFKLEILGYSKVYNGLEVVCKDLVKEESSKTKAIFDENLNKYKEAYKNNDMELLLKSDIKFEPSLYFKIAKFQVELLSTFNNDNIKLLIKDKINPLRFQSVFNVCRERKNTYDIKDMVLSTEEVIIENFTNRIRKIYRKMFNTKSMYIDNIIFSYMNTSARYFLNFDEFILMLAKSIRKNNESKVELSRYFKDYNIVCEDIVDGKIISPVQINANCLVSTDTSIKPDDISCYKFYIKNYDFEKNIVEVEDVMLIKTAPKNSKMYKKLITVLVNYLNSSIDDKKALDDIKNVEKVQEFKHLSYALSYNLLKEYELIYKEIVSKNIVNGLENLSTFIKNLGDNNYWKYKAYDKLIESEEENDYIEIKNIFLKQAKETNFFTVIFCYNNTFIKEILPLDELLSKIFKFNIFQNVKIDEENMVNLQEYNIPLDVVYSKNIQVYDGLFVINVVSNNKKLNIKLDEEDLKLLSLKSEDKVFLNLSATKYDLKNNIIYCKIKYIKKLNDEKYKYVLQYLSKLNNIIKNNYSIDYIFDYINKASIISENLYYYDSEKNMFFRRNFTISDCKASLKTLLEKYNNILYKRITKYITSNVKNGSINKENINKLFFIYDKTILKYIISLNDFSYYVREIINQNIDVVRLYIKLKTNSCLGNSLYKVYIPRYDSSQIVKLDVSDNIEIINQQNYVAKISKYDNVNECVILDNVSIMTKREIEIFEEIAKEVYTEDELINLIDTQISLIGKVTKNIILKMSEKKRGSARFLNNYDSIEKEKLEKLKNLSKEFFEYKVDFIIEEYEKVLSTTSFENLRTVIYYYMNTAIRYVLKVSLFIDLILKYFKDEFEEVDGIVNVCNIFRYYKMPIDDITEEGNIKTALLSDDNDFVLESSLINRYKDKNLLSGRVKIDRYDTVNKVIIADKIYFKDINNSKEV